MMHFTDDTDKIEIPTHAETSEEAKTLLLTKTGVNIEESKSQPKKNKNSGQEWPLLHEGSHTKSQGQIITLTLHIAQKRH